MDGSDLFIAGRALLTKRDIARFDFPPELTEPAAQGD
jgi:hypothetical protein